MHQPGFGYPGVASPTERDLDDLDRSGWHARLAQLAVVLVWGLLGGCYTTVPPTVAPLRISAPPIHEIRLDNGLRVFVVERRSSQTFTGIFSFDVGGADDPRGKSGIAHLLEHMMFKGTRELGALAPERQEQEMAKRLDTLWRTLDAERAPIHRTSTPSDPGRQARLLEQITVATREYRHLVASDEYESLLSRAGVVDRNAGTNFDTTSYFAQVPSSRLELWLRGESTRFQHPVFREFYTERDVVREERRKNKDSLASSLVDEALRSALFSAHPYGTPIIGWPGDIEHLQRDDALEFFRTYYTPSRCVVVLVGDVQIARVEQLAQRYLGMWKTEQPGQSAAFRFTTPEPEQIGERRRVLEQDATPQLALGWATVPLGHPDQAPLEVLAKILSGIRHARLSRGLGGGSATQVSFATAGYFLARATPRPWPQTASWHESHFDRVIRDIHDGGVTETEVARAKLELQNGFLPGLDSDATLAHRIARTVTMVGSLRFLEEYPLRIAAVTTDQVRQVALRYLRPTRKCVVELRRPALRTKPVTASVAPLLFSPSLTSAKGVNPMTEQSRHSKAYTAALGEILAAPLYLPPAPQVGKEVQRIVLPSGITLFLLEDHTRPQVTLDFVWLGGINSAPIRDLDAYQLGAGVLSSAGTETMSPEALSERKKELGMSFGISFGSTTSEAELFTPAQTFESSYDLAMEILMRPRLGELRLWQRKFSVLDSMQARGETLGSGASHVLHYVLAGAHPRLGYVPGKWQLLLTTWPYHIRRLWHRYLGRDNLYIAAVGDIRKQSLINKIESTLGRWRLAEDSQRDFLARPPVIAKGAFLVRKSLPGAAVILAHQIPIDRTASDREHAALRMIQAILGRSDLQSRLYRRLRAQEGLTYGVSMSLEHEGRPGVPGQVTVSYQTKTGQVFHSIVCVLDEMEQLRSHDVSPAELKEQQERWRNQLAISYSDRTASVQRVMSHEISDRPSDFDQRVLAAIEQVTPADIRRVAQKYIHPELLTVALFGTLSPDDEAQIKVRFGLKILESQTVFRGGYD